MTRSAVQPAPSAISTTGRLLRIGLALAFVAATLMPAAAQLAPHASPDYVIGVSDVLQITVWRQEDLSDSYTVAADGTIAFPLIGSVKVAGLPVKDVEEELMRRLADGFLRKPQVTVAVQAFRSQQIFLVGEVRTPGPVPLTGELTLVEALAKGGALTDAAGGEVIVLRQEDASAPTDGRPVLPGTPGAREVQRFDLNELRAGRVAENVALQHGDTIFVTRTEMVFVLGQVNAPGSYPFEKDMTVLRALNLAGGVAQLGASNRVRVRRLVDGKVVEIRVNLTDVLQPRDTIFVPTRLI
jgi:polysaccharide export outer membrane protein